MGKNAIKFSDVVKVVDAEYVYLELKTTSSTRNNKTDGIAKAISSLYKTISQSIERDEYRLIKLMGKDRYYRTFTINKKVKVSYYIHLKKGKARFFFILPKRYRSILQERIRDSWSNIEIKEVKSIPEFSPDALSCAMRYEKEDAFSLAVDKSNNDLLRSNLSILNVLEEGDEVGIFYNFIPVNYVNWLRKSRDSIRRYEEGESVDKLSFSRKSLFGEDFSIVRSSAKAVQLMIEILLEAFTVMETKKPTDKNSIDFLLDRMRRPISNNTKRKSESSTLVDTQIILLSDSVSGINKRNNLKALSNSFDSIKEDNRLIPTKQTKINFSFTDFETGDPRNTCSTDELSNVLALPGLELIEEYKIDAIQTNQTSIPDELQKGIVYIGINDCKGEQTKAYLSEYEPKRFLSLFLIGPTRAGKTTLIQNIISDSLDAGDCCIFIDYIDKCQASGQIVHGLDKNKVLRIKCDDIDRLQAIAYNEISHTDNAFKQYANAKLQANQLISFLDSVNETGMQPLTRKMKNLLQAAEVINCIVGGKVSDTFDLLMFPEKRKSVIDSIYGDIYKYVSPSINALSFLDKPGKGEDAETENRDDKVSGIIDRLSVLQSNPYMEQMLYADKTNNINLLEEIEKNQLITIEMPDIMFPTVEEKDIYTTYWLTKIWLALQVRAGQCKNETERLGMRKVNLIIDELYQVNNAEIYLTKRLSQFAKYRIKPIISCHYIEQLKYMRKELHSANPNYMLVAGCDAKNFYELQDELYPFTAKDLVNLNQETYECMNLLRCKTGKACFIARLPPPLEKRIQQKQKDGK